MQALCRHSNRAQRYIVDYILSEAKNEEILMFRNILLLAVSPCGYFCAEGTQKIILFRQ
jgi:hypothetical protein